MLRDVLSTQLAKLSIEYDGTGFHGWSRQPGLPTVEGVILDAFGCLNLRDVVLRCAGRTDAGVHAERQIVSVRYDGPIEPGSLARALNSVLVDGVAVTSSCVSRSGFDARADARARHYEYRVLARSAPSPLRALRTLHHPRPIDVALLEEAAAAVVGQHDFTAFTPTSTEHVFFRRTVYHSTWEPRDDELVYRIAANAFLRHMVRVLVGTMLAVGRGDWPLERFVALLDGAPRARAHHTAPPHGLCLVDVEYGP